MSKNTSIILGDHFDQFIQKEIKTGRYASASEIVRMGLRLLEQETRKIELINEALVVGEMSGKPVEFDNEEFKSRMKANLNL
ncbi:MAG: toxin-antitoxin system CC2985 family antidote component [Algoriphagus marincola HL-49]|uniref:Toxin-antitoxin system CC2985 family antidote component n=1 Tax=Algoriphagus marincola HL-49 TaxID=1305737 RepID=A0A0P7Y1H7_9BACT|nr:MAG: toxin-antitoxin system CC2985 family antidote component [Algoriphagus marincola HL-49]